MKKIFSIGISAIIPAIVGMLLSFLLLFIDFYTDERRMEMIMANQDTFWMVFPFLLENLSGVLFILTEIITGIVLKRKNILTKKETSITLLIGTVLYAFLMFCLFPYSRKLKFMYQYLPARELAADYTIFLFVIFSCAAALLCGLFHLVTLVCAKKSSD